MLFGGGLRFLFGLFFRLWDACMTFAMTPVMKCSKAMTCSMLSAMDQRSGVSRKLHCSGVRPSMSCSRRASLEASWSSTSCRSLISIFIGVLLKRYFLDFYLGLGLWFVMQPILNIAEMDAACDGLVDCVD